MRVLLSIWNAHSVAEDWQIFIGDKDSCKRNLPNWARSVSKKMKKKKKETVGCIIKKAHLMKIINLVGFNRFKGVLRERKQEGTPKSGNQKENHAMCKCLWVPRISRSTENPEAQPRNQVQLQFLNKLPSVSTSLETDDKWFERDLHETLTQWQLAIKTMWCYGKQKSC